MNIQRNIFAGLLIFVVFLTIPIYLDLIGVEQGPEFEGADLPIINEPADSLKNKQAISRNSDASNTFNNDINNIEHLITVTTNYYEMVMSNRAGGTIIAYQLIEKNKDLTPKYIGSYNHINYNDSLMVKLINNINRDDCAPCFQIDGKKINGIFSMNSKKKNIVLNPGESYELVFKYQLSVDEYIEKSIVLNGDGFSFDSKYSYQLNTSNKQSLEIVWDSGILPTEPGDADVWEGHSAAYVYQKDNLESIIQGDALSIESQKFDKETDWFAIRNKYFGVIVIPNNAMEYATLASKNNSTFEGRDITPIYTVSMGSNLNRGVMQASGGFKTYVGPLDIDHISLLGSNVESIMNFGWTIIKPFSKMILWLIKSLHNGLGLNYGFVLIVLGVIMRIIMGPLTRKSAESSTKMQEVAPLQKKIQEKYKDNPQQLQKEMGALWKEHGVNPISGCLPMLLQWPVLMSLFIVFRSTIEFRGQPFIFWIKDLSQPDYIFSLPFAVPLYGSGVAVLPIIMGISMFLTMSITMQDKSQKPMMYFMNTFFILIFNSFPSGLTLYYTIFNFLSYQQQLSIKKNK